MYRRRTDGDGGSCLRRRRKGGGVVGCCGWWLVTLRCGLSTDDGHVEHACICVVARVTCHVHEPRLLVCCGCVGLLTFVSGDVGSPKQCGCHRQRITDCAGRAASLRYGHAKTGRALAQMNARHLGVDRTWTV